LIKIFKNFERAQRFIKIYECATVRLTKADFSEFDSLFRG